MDGIRAGELREGQRLPPEPDLLVQWKISPSSLRDAFKELETLGLLSRKPRVGTVIRRFDPSHLFGRCAELMGHRPELRVDLMQMREVIEPAMVTLVCERARAEDWEGMEAAVEGMRKSATMEELDRHDLDFHRHFYVATRNAFFEAMIPILVEFFTVPLPFPREEFEAQKKEDVRRHARFLGALRKGDVATARRHADIVTRFRVLDPADANPPARGGARRKGCAGK